MMYSKTSSGPIFLVKHHIEREADAQGKDTGTAIMRISGAAKKIRRTAHNLFAFCEHAGAEPTSSAAELALRDAVVRRKIIGQIK